MLQDKKWLHSLTQLLWSLKGDVNTLGHVSSFLLHRVTVGEQDPLQRVWEEIKNSLACPINDSFTCALTDGPWGSGPQGCWITVGVQWVANKCFCHFDTLGDLLANCSRVWQVAYASPCQFVYLPVSLRVIEKDVSIPNEWWTHRICIGNTTAAERKGMTSPLLMV